MKQQKLIVSLSMQLAAALGLAACDSGDSNDTTTQASTTTGVPEDDTSQEDTAGDDSAVDDTAVDDDSGQEEGPDGAGDSSSSADDDSGDATGGTDEGSGDGTSDDGGASVDVELIDDLEDGDDLIYPESGRQGAWYVYNDGSATGIMFPPAQEPFVTTAGGPNSSLYVANTSGSGFAVWGAGIGFDLNNAGDKDGGPGLKEAWDGSSYRGVAFYARGNVTIRLKVLTMPIVPVAEGGLCEIDCNDSFGRIVPLSEEWTQYVVYFDDLLQEGWGLPVAFDPAELAGLQFQVQADADFDFSIDDVGLIR